MGRFIVCAIFGLFCAGLALHLIPATGHLLFQAGPIPVTGFVLIGIGCCWGGYKLSGKK